jgi:hypothetical protein
MTTRRSIFRILAVAVTGVAVYLGLTWLLVFLVFDVLKISGGSQADLNDLVMAAISLLVPRVVPFVGAVFAALFVAKKLRGKPDDGHGFAVLPPDPGRQGAP